MENLHKNHRDRLRQRFQENGLKNFPDHNILELALFYAIPRKDTNELAHRLIDQFGSLSAVLDAPFADLAKVEGMGEASATFLKLIPALSAAYLDSLSAPALILDAPSKAAEHLIPKFIGLPREAMFVVSLDPQLRQIATRQVSQGDQTSTAVSLRHIIGICLETNASSVIVAHNHPRGKPLPSRSDYITSTRITEALGLIGVEVADHMIIAGKEYISLGNCESFFAATEDFTSE